MGFYEVFLLLAMDTQPGPGHPGDGDSGLLKILAMIFGAIVAAVPVWYTRKTWQEKKRSNDLEEQKQKSASLSISLEERKPKNDYEQKVLESLKGFVDPPFCLATLTIKNEGMGIARNIEISLLTGASSHAFNQSVLRKVISAIPPNEKTLSIDLDNHPIEKELHNFQLEWDDDYKEGSKEILSTTIKGFPRN